ncbi:MAG: class I SAM-dependent methyltransferase [Methylococcaceae bacterium]
MTDWTSGYVTDVGYTFGYYTELNPLRLKLAFLHAGLHFPKVGAACELGFGQGLSANLHAAASITRWTGTDFNPSQAAFAQELAEVSQANAQLFDQSFAQFNTSLNDQPEFDYIGLHGIWSWISNENRAVIVDFIARKLKVGGVLYISYNTQPGWANMSPVRDLLARHAQVMGSAGQSIVSKVDNALAFVEQLFAVNPSYSRVNPQLAPRFKKITEQNRNYLAHEYFNQDWQPMLFSQMHHYLSAAKLQFACSAHYFDQVDDLNLTAEQQGLVNGLSDTAFKETVRDFCINQQFRRDYWVKGARRLSALEQIETLRTQRLILIQYRADVVLKVTGSLGESTLQERIYSPILDCFASYQIKTIAEIEQAISSHNISLAQLTQALLILAGMSVIATVQDDEVIEKALPQTQRLNTYLCEKARNNGEITNLASPVTGGGISIGRFGQLFLLARAKGIQQSSAWAQSVWEVLKLQKQLIIKDGVTLQSEAENMAELIAQAQNFEEKILPILQALKIA